MARKTPRLSSPIIQLTEKKIPQKHAVFLRLTFTSQPSVCVRVCVCACLCERQRQQGLSGQTTALSPRSHLSVQSGESMAERKPITRSFPPDPR